MRLASSKILVIGGRYMQQKILTAEQCDIIYKELITLAQVQDDSQSYAFRDYLNMLQKEGFPVDYIPASDDPDNVPLLYKMLLWHKVEHAKVILESGADVNVKVIACKKQNALLYASSVLVYDMDLLKAIVRKTDNINYTDEQSFTALSQWCTNQAMQILNRGNKNLMPIIRMLINAGADPYVGVAWEGNFLRPKDYALAKKIKDYAIKYYKTGSLLKQETIDSLSSSYDYAL